MKPSSKALIGLTGVLFIVLLGMAGTAYYLISKSAPETEGRLRLNGLLAPVRIYRDAYGVPHVIAESDHDAYFAVGFVHAQERLWQMELIRRAGMGRLSEILGEPALKTDKMFRTLGLWREAQALGGLLDDTTRAALTAYAAGINAFIDGHKGRWPIEFDMLGFEPEPWSPEHSLLMSRLMGWELNYARWVDLVLGEFVRRFGEERARDLFPAWPKDAPIIVPSESRKKAAARLAAEWFDAERSYRSLVGYNDFQTGSNSWAISGAKTLSGKPLLANDPHLFLTAPARWFDLHVVTPTLDVEGVSIVGVPFVVIGRNRSIAWGVTNAMLDDEDFYYERVDSIQHPTRSLLNGNWVPVTERVDTILVRDGLPVILTTYSTQRGPIINRMEPAAEYSPDLVSMRWTGFEPSNEARAFYSLNRATSWNDFKRALRSFGVPAQNFVFADTAGNIGYYTAGKLPIRPQNGPTLPAPGWTSAYDWKGFVRFENMPQCLNPDQGFIVTANNRIADDRYPYYISNYWEPEWRAERISSLLREGGSFTAEDCERIQNDVYSLQAKTIVPIILHAFEHQTVDDPRVSTCLTYLRNWNFEMKKEDVATTLFESTSLHIIHNTLHPWLGTPLLGLYDTLASMPLALTTRLLQDSSSAWFDDPRTEQREGRDDIIRASVRDAVAELQATLGGELKEWQWGRVHTITFGHVFGTRKLLQSIFNVGPFQREGSHSTVNKGDFLIEEPYRSTVGPSTRQIFDLADPNRTAAVTPPGESGQPFNAHYRDQVALWLDGGYREMPMDISRIERSCRELLILEPSP